MYNVTFRGVSITIVAVEK